VGFLRTTAAEPRPAAQPVRYLVDGGEINFRTADASKLATATRNAVVGFQVDRLDTTTRSGWSVLGVSHAYEVTATANSSAMSSTAPGPGRGECARRIHDGSPRGLTPATRKTPRHETPP
jgi:Pyridoxamine 5'-phosphate oxidase